MISGMTILSSEFIPIYHYAPGGVALVIWIPMCKNTCNYCPWYASSSLREVDLITVSLDKIIEIAHRVKANYIFIHGGQPIEFIESKTLDKLCNLEIPLGAKLCIDSLENFQEVAKKLDVVLVEVTLNKCSKIMKYTKILSSLNSEIILVSGGNESITKIINCLNYLRKIEKPIHIYLELDVRDANHIAKYSHNIGIKYLYFPLTRVADLNTTYCPKCGAIIVYRENGIILRHHAKDTKCFICGTNILYKAIPTRLRTGVNYAIPRELLTDT